jgi:hypothetical protein
MARPNNMTMFQMDPMRKATVDGCATCHVNPRGGGPRNDFGLAFDNAGRVITPLLRANFQDRFDVQTSPVPNGGLLYFSDPSADVIVFEKDMKKYVVDLAAVIAGRLVDPATISAAPTAAAAPKPDTAPGHPIKRFSFFITSTGTGNGGNLGGLAGADRHCQALAGAVGAGDKTWRAYLSTSYDGKPAVNAGDRIGSGPWYNSKGLMVAAGPADLHGANNRLTKERALTEKGTTPDLHDILTGTLPDGTAAVDQNCFNWTSANEGVALLGHFDREGGGDNPRSWNAAHPSRSCSVPDLRATGGDGLFYCFAVHPQP